MKKLFVALLMLIGLAGFANTPNNGEKVNRKVKAALEKEFAGASYVVWQPLKDNQLFHAKFLYNNEHVNAFFEEDGNLLAIGRYIETAALPLSITKSINSQYAGYLLKDAIEFTRNGETSYVLSLENEKSRVVLEGYTNGSLYLFKKEKKNFLAKL